jgi:aminotransferase
MTDSKSLRDRLAKHVSAVPRSGIRDFFDIVSQMPDIISLGIGEPDFDTPWHIRESAIEAIENGVTHYTSNLGSPELRAGIAKYLAKYFKVGYNPETEILISVGVSEALDLAIRALINPGDEVLYHEPCYVSYRPLITMAHGVPVVVPTTSEENFRLTRAQLEKRVSDKTKLLLLNFPNNPTGAVLERRDVEDIAAFAIAHDLIVITDEIYAELSYEGEHVSIAALPGMKERTIFLHGMSKAWAMTGFRIGYACAPQVLTEAMMKIHQYSMLCAPVLSQHAALEALRHPESDVAEMREEYHRRRDFLIGSFAEMGIPCVKPNGAFYAFPDVSEFGLSSYDFAMRLIKEYEVAVVPGTAFGECGAGFVRCSYATSLEQIREAMRRLAQFAVDLRG